MRLNILTENKEVIQVELLYQQEGSDGGYFRLTVTRGHLILHSALFRDSKLDPLQWESHSNKREIPEEAVKLFRSFQKLCGLCLILFAFLFSSCSQSPYWAVYRNDGLEKKMYLKQGWPRDHKCTAYVNNRPIKRSTWANQFYYRPKKAKL